MTDSSDDDLPIGARIGAQAAATLRGDDDGEDRGSPLPDWISQAATTPTQNLRGRISSDSDSVLDLGTQPEKQGGATAGDAQQSRDDDAEQAGPSQPAELPAKGKAKGKAKASQGGTPGKAGLAAAAPAGTIPVMLPERMAKGRILVQLEPGEGGATDLAGDMGTVGRFAASDQPGREGDMMLDLKGTIYSTSVVPCATTLCVVNIQQHEAKIEAVMDSFVALREEAAPGSIGADLQRFLDEDDDPSMFDEEAGKPAKGAKRKKAEEGVEGPPKKKRAPAKGAAGKPGAAKRKPPTKKGAGGKGKAAGKAKKK